MRLLFLFCLCLALAGSLILPEAACSRSAHSPRHSGMDAPGGPRQLDNMPMSGPSRTPEGGMGYTDAYGRSLTDKTPEERKQRQRLRPGAYAKKEPVAELPDIDPARQAPVWSFR